MAEKSKPIRMHDEEKLAKINQETMQCWKKYKIDMELRELSPGTQEGYLNDLQHWWLYIYDHQGNQSVTELDEDDVTEFLYWCKTQGNNSRRMRRRMSSISAFYKFLRKKKIMLDNPMEYIDRPKNDVDVVVQTYLTPEQIVQMRDALNEQVSAANTVYAKHMALLMRLYAFFSLSTMARVNAVSNVRWDQIDYEARTVSGVVEKEGYIVDLYFSKEVEEYLRELRTFRDDNQIEDSGCVFAVSMAGKIAPLANSTLNDWCKKIGRIIGVPTLHPHDFRHSGATLLKNNGMALEDISKLLHHQGTDVTNRYYIKSDAKKLQGAKDQFEVF